MATIKEVSRLANVSMATVSRVLNGTVPVTEPTRVRVMEAVERLGYQPNMFARGLATNRSNGIGVVVNDIASPYFGPMLGGIERVAETYGLHLMVLSGHADAGSEREALQFLLQRRADALIVHVEGISDYDLIKLSSPSLPLVIVGRYINELADRCVYLNNEAGGYLLTRYLLENGHRRVAHVAGPQALYDSRARLQGYRRALEEAGIRYDEALVVEADFQEEGGCLATHRLLDRQLDFTALFAGNDQMAAGALTAFREAGLEVPNDISLVGYDDVLLARYLYPALTTIRQPMAEMGQAAARLVLAALKGTDSKEVKRKFEPTLVVRDSVKTLG
jgi:LacI family transcriptional regulator